MMVSKLQLKLEEFLHLPAETEWIEFKEAKTSFDLDKLGEYFSALSNEANLKAQENGWLIFGVTDKPPRRLLRDGTLANQCLAKYPNLFGSFQLWNICDYLDGYRYLDGPLGN